MLIDKTTIYSLISVHALIAVYWINTLVIISPSLKKHLLIWLVLKILGLIIEAIQALLLAACLKYIPKDNQSREIAKNIIEYSTILNYVAVGLMVLFIIVYVEVK